MNIYSLGINYRTEEPLLSQRDEEQFTQGILRQFGAAPPTTGADEAGTGGRPAPVFREAAEVKRERTTDQGDPLTAGWTLLVNRDDPRRDDYLRILCPLAKLRGMKNPEQPLLFDGSPYTDWQDWLLENYTPTDLSDPPLYVLIVGGPEQVPFRFQSFLDASAAVGRLDFESPDDLAAYVEKVIALESAPAPVVGREALFFAPDGGPADATYFSRRFMADPLARMAEHELRFGVKRLLEVDATRQQLRENLQGRHPALVYTASHGLGAPDEPLETQRRLNGSIVCQREGREKLRERLFTADDIPRREPFLEGAVFFQFACFGYGTPARSDFANWDPGLEAQNAARDFVAALPRRLLSHPRGPVAYLGHIDTAFLHGFDDPDDPDLGQRWSPRLKPFIEALKSLLNVQPVGLALQEMNKRYNTANAYLTNLLENNAASGTGLSREQLPRIASSYILRNDAQNYMVLGDPAVRLRIPEAA
ncbi:MAG: hypothetical protein ACM3QS_14645 [Bacteroidota bacterium]